MIALRSLYPWVAFLTIGAGTGTSCANPVACDPARSSCHLPVVSTAIGREFDLAPGGIAKVDGTRLTISFTSIGDDSRCPTSVVCVWAGSASADLRIDLSDALWNVRPLAGLIGEDVAELAETVWRP